MDTDLKALLLGNLLEVFGERDPEVRRVAAERIYADDVRFADPEETVVGVDAVVAKAQKILDEAPGFVFSPDGPVHQSQEMGHLAWAFGPEGADPVVRGFDVCLVSGGRITNVYTVILGPAD